EFVERKFSMKEIHRLIVTSETYKQRSAVEPALAGANMKIDPENICVWHYPLRRLEAEPIWDSIFAAAGALDTSVGGPSFDVDNLSRKTGGKIRSDNAPGAPSYRRAAYMVRGYSSQRDVVPAFLQAFDVDDGRAPCPVRTRTVTAPQALFLMNSPEIDRASAAFAERVKKESGGDLKGAVDLAYQTVLSRPPSGSERKRALAFL